MLIDSSLLVLYNPCISLLDLEPNIRFTTWDDYAIMSMVEAGLGISILPMNF